MRPGVGSCDSLHHGCAQSIGTQPGRVNGEHLAVKLDNRADAGLPAQEFGQIVMVGADKQANFIAQSHLPGMTGNLGFGLELHIDPVRQLRRTNRSEILTCNARHEESQTVQNISGVNSTVMLVQSVLHHQAPPGLVRARTWTAPNGWFPVRFLGPHRDVIE